MSPEKYAHIEQDRTIHEGGDELPTYDDLATQYGPNSRFGRWRGWIEKRAAERYIDVSPEERARRRDRGWGNEDMVQSQSYDEGQSGGQSMAFSVHMTGAFTQPPTSARLQTNHIDLSSPPSSVPRTPSPPLPPLPFVNQRLTPTHLRMNQFGSRFLPHTTSPIRCLLPLESERLLLVGHDEGLSVLDMFPQEWSESGVISVKGPDEAQCRLIWQGESVYQMTLLEVENTGEGTSQGVVLVLVGPDPDTKEADLPRSLRMYNLASLTSLAKWAVSQKGARPLDLHRPPHWQVQQTPTKRHRPQSSITRGLKSLIDLPSVNQVPEPYGASYQTLLSPSASSESNDHKRSRPPSGRLTPNRRKVEDSSWDLIEDLPLRWATDFVPLATSGSRLVNTSILSYAMWADESRKGRGGQLLALATKNSILLYETPKGERAFRFVKEFYTPLQPRNITFFQQSVQDVNRSPTDVNTPRSFNLHKKSESATVIRSPGDRPRASPSLAATLDYGVHLSLFVIFDKKAGWIRLTDSAVGEIEFHDSPDPQQPRQSDSQSPGLSTSSILRSRISLDGHHHSLGRWAPPVRCELPIPRRPGMTRQVHLLTRGKQTQIVPCPLPVSTSMYSPLCVVSWQSSPTHVSPRVYEPPLGDGYVPPPFVQLVAFGEDGVEVQEISLSFLGKGKGKARLEEPVRAEEDLGGNSGLLCTGGHWDQSHRAFHRPTLNRAYSAASNYSSASMDSDELLKKIAREQGIYGWCRKGAQDWRVFWVGGSLAGGGDDDIDPI